MHTGTKRFFAGARRQQEKETTLDRAHGKNSVLSDNNAADVEPVAWRSGAREEGQGSEIFMPRQAMLGFRA